MEDAPSRILAAHYLRYPCLQIADLYKLLHQAAMGSEHAVSDEAGARAWLEQELAMMGTGPQEPLIDAISPSGEIVRVHLRSYVAAGHDPQTLLEAFLRTAREYRGSVEQLQRYGEVAVHMASAGLLPFQPDQIAELMQDMKRQAFPAMHHSCIYERLYRPAYRVIARRFAEPVLRV